MRVILLSALAICSFVGLSSAARGFGGDTRMILDAGNVSDKRFEAVRNLNTRCDVTYLASDFNSAAQWKKRAADLREQVLASAGLLPMPGKTPLNVVNSGLIDRGDYTVENVYFESFPGFYVAGNLYRPKGEGPFPAVLNTHGHWHEGRFENTGRSSIAGRCISFARQGYVAFSCDMVGRNDSRQFTHTPETLADRRNRLWGISLGGLQLWNSIRGVDFLQSLPCVDKKRIACTGASGGGTQTFLLTAVDDRVCVSAPVNMISAHMQGGCRCENLPNLRVDTDNVEIGALMAPRPMIMISATGDWTSETPEVEFPAVRSIYRLLEAEERVSCARIDAEHNYNKASREAVYSWFGQWLPAKPLHQPVSEQPFEVEPVERVLVFADGKLPDGALSSDGVVSEIKRFSEDQLQANRPHDEPSLERFRKLYEPALRRALSVPASMEIEVEARLSRHTNEYHETSLIIRDTVRGAEVPGWLFEPLAETNGKAVLMVEEKGSKSLTSAGATVRLLGLVHRGYSVLTIDCFGTGAHSAPSGSPRREVDVDFFDTYNRTDAAERVYDILLAARYLQSRNDLTSVSMIGSGRAGLWCLLAKPFARKIEKLVVDAGGLDTLDDDALLGDLYVPCLRRAGDFRTATMLCAPNGLYIHNAQGRFDGSWAGSAYKAAGRTDALRVLESPAADTDILKWLQGI